MTDKMVNGILFIIAGLGPVAVYIGLGPDGTGILNNAQTEKSQLIYCLLSPSLL